MFFLPTTVNMKYLKVNSIDYNSNISTGMNVVINRNVKFTINHGFGEQNADGVEVHIPISFVDDRDMMDSVRLKK